MEKLGTSPTAPNARNANSKTGGGGGSRNAGETLSQRPDVRGLDRVGHRELLAQRLGLTVGQPQPDACCLLDRKPTARRWLGFVDAEVPDLPCQCRLCHEARTAKLLLLDPRCQCSRCVATRRMVVQVREIHTHEGGLLRAEHIDPVLCPTGRVPRRLAPMFEVIRLDAPAAVDLAA